MYSVFDIEEGGVVWCTCFIEYFKVAAVQSRVNVDDTIEARFFIILEDDQVAEDKYMMFYYKSVDQCDQIRTASGDVSPLILAYLLLSLLHAWWLCSSKSILQEVVIRFVDNNDAQFVDTENCGNLFDHDYE